MPGERGVLGKIGQGLISFGSGVPSSQIDTIRNNRDLSDIQLQQARSEVADNADVRILGQRAAQGDEDAITELIGKRPELATKIMESAEINTQIKREDLARFADEVLATPDPKRREQIIKARVAQDPERFKDTAELLELPPEEQDARLKIAKASALSESERLANQNQQTRISQADRGLDQGDARIAQSDRGLDLQEAGLVLSAQKSAADASLKADERITKEREADLKTEEGLRKEVNSLMGDFFKVSDSFARIQAAGTEPTAAGDLALIFNFMKMLDPGSTVREGEFATAQNSGGIPSRVVAFYNNALKGERLSETQRDDFLGRSQKLFDSQLGEAQKTANAYEDIATKAGVDVNAVLANFTERATEQPEAQNTEGQTATNPQTGERIVFRNGQWVPL